MINRLLLLALVFSCSLTGLEAQQRDVNLEPTARRTITDRTFLQPAGELTPRNVADTLFPGAFNDVCGATQVLYDTDVEWGFIAGTNGFGDKEKAQLIQNTTNTTITVKEAWAFFGYVSSVGNGGVRMKIYRPDPVTGGPSSLVAQSNDVRVDDISYDDTEVLATPFSFPTAVSLDNPSFFLSMDFSSLYNTFDTVALFHTELGCGNGLEAYDLWSDDQWFSVTESWLTENGTFEINYSLAAIIEFEGPSSVDDPYYQQGQLRLFPATPNPSRETVQLNYELEEPGMVKIEIYTSDGRRLEQLNLGQQAVGRYIRPIDVTDLPAGSYVYTILTEKGRVASRFIVQ